MSITIKNESEINKMRIAGKLASEVLEMIEPHVIPGVTTNELNKLCHDYIVEEQQAIPAPLNYRGFPKSICTSVNQTICHGIPNEKRLKKGDIVNIDITVIKDEYHGDTSKMFAVGTVSQFAQRLMKVTQESLYLGIEQVKPGATLGDIGHAIQKHAESNRYSIVREFCGHGIGKNFHEDPHVMHFGKAGKGEVLEAGMIITIEPMLNLGKRHMKVQKDGWTAVTKDRSLSAQWEHTILITPTSHEVLTFRQEEL
ncbi:MAG: type I methionyl aminopeptidase [Methylococcales symbiont of Iophon sp. n. MRB-2018]|nr:MAG: type I methionyl aminopeptidase [Methylococcales symbiont of Iophon sp. n. MRB-2018]KAF3980572.1 MAG: type I methionyl aminopeptidase [Methylococcales symbiont of Iophon sp. n. MRB-2018]